MHLFSINPLQIRFDRIGVHVSRRSDERIVVREKQKEVLKQRHVRTYENNEVNINYEPFETSQRYKFETSQFSRKKRIV